VSLRRVAVTGLGPVSPHGDDPGEHQPKFVIAIPGRPKKFFDAAV
jgi:hypothetical protein